MAVERTGFTRERHRLGDFYPDLFWTSAWLPDRSKLRNRRALDDNPAAGGFVNRGVQHGQICALRDICHEKEIKESKASPKGAAQKQAEEQE